MTTTSLLSSLKRKSQRQSLFSNKKGVGIRGFVSKYKRQRMTERRDIKDTKVNSNEKVNIDKFTLSAMRIEVENLLESSPNQKTSVFMMATTLVECDSVMTMHRSSNEEDEDGIITGLSRMNLSGSKSSSLSQALHSLATRVGSTTTFCSSWKQAKTELETVLEFPPPSQKRRASSSSFSSEVQRYMNQIRQATRKDALRQQESRRWFQQLSHTITVEPDLIGEDAKKQQEEENKRSSVIEEVDAKLDKIVSDAYKERRVSSGIVAELEKEEHEKEAQEKASSLLRPLSEEEQAIVQDAMYSHGNEEQVVAQVGTDSVQRGSMHRLQPGQWLNDEVIHYFYVMLSKRDEELCKTDPTKKRSHFFKSFFITKLLDIGNADPALDGKYNYKNVKRWSKRVPGKDVFALDKIFFPINVGGVHWICAVAFMTEKRIQLYDSMGSSGRYYLESVFQYLQDEHKAKKGGPMPDIDKWQLVGTTRDTPQQLNGFDCGVFTCMFADFLSTDCPLVFSQEHITQCRERIALSIMSGSAIM